MNAEQLLHASRHPRMQDLGIGGEPRLLDAKALVIGTGRLAALAAPAVKQLPPIQGVPPSPTLHTAPVVTAMANLTALIRMLLLLLVLPFAPVLHAEEQPAKAPIRIGLTAVFLDDQAAFINAWRDYLQRRMARPVSFVQRGSYREIVDLLRNGKLDFAWLCGYPYVLNKNSLRLVAMPLYLGEPLYQSYLIVPSTDKQTNSLADLSRKNFAFSDPDSNSGHLYIEYLLARQGNNSPSFFARTFYTWSHRKVVEAVAAGLAQGGAVDGYVWDTLAFLHPELTSKTRIVNKSPKFGHPPFVAGGTVPDQDIAALQKVLFYMKHDEEGSLLLNRLNLDGFVYGNERLFDSIQEMVRFVENSKNDAVKKR